MKKSKIESIVLSDKNDSTHVVDIIKLDDGRVIQAWNGNASYCVYDKAHGNIAVGSVLISSHEEESYNGEPYTVYVFA